MFRRQTTHAGKCNGFTVCLVSKRMRGGIDKTSSTGRLATIHHDVPMTDWISDSSGPKVDTLSAILFHYKI